MRKTVILVVAIAVVLPLAIAAPAGAAVTIGSDLAPNPTSGQCTGPCTVANFGLPGGQVSSPTDGVVTSWAVRYIGSTTGIRLRVLRPLGMNVFQGVNSSITQNLPNIGSATTTIFKTQQPIKANDIVGLDLDPSNTVGISTTTQTMVTSGLWQPELVDGGQSFSPTATSVEYTFNATIEPDCDHDGLGDETQDPDISSCNPKPKDTTPPNTTIGKGPKKVIHATGPKTKVKFTFSSTETLSTFKCKLDKKAFAACTSPKTYKVKLGKHSFQVEAVDAAGNIDATPAKKKFKVLPAVQ